MKRALLVLTSVLFGVSVLAQAPRITTTTAAADAVVKTEMRSRGIPGVAVAVVEDGKVLLERAYGFLNLETQTPLTTSSIFEIASLTKQFTAAAIMMLVEEAKIRLDDPVSTYIDGTPAEWSRITVRHLLTHTSGLDISAMPSVDGSAPLSISTRPAFEFIVRQPMFAATGRTGWYSDAGYVLLGMVVEKASGRTYREFITERIFKPLKMNDSSLRDKARVLKGRVSTYAHRNGEVVNWRRESDYELPSAFGIHSTLRDLAIWDNSLRRATLLKPTSLEQIWTPAILESGRHAQVFMERYGFGWELSELRGRPTVGHGGASGTYILRFVEEPLTVIVLTNLESENRHPRVLARAVAGAVRPAYQPPDRLTPQADPDGELTRGVEALLFDITARRSSSMMTEAYAAKFGASPGERAVMAKQLAGAGSLKFLAQDDLGGRTLWGGEKLARLVHYAADVKGRTYFLTVEVTPDRKIASLKFQGG